jgi:hypothetical protein
MSALSVFDSSVLTICKLHLCIPLDASVHIEICGSVLDVETIARQMQDGQITMDPARDYLLMMGNVRG